MRLNSRLYTVEIRERKCGIVVENNGITMKAAAAPTTTATNFENNYEFSHMEWIYVR